MWTIQLYTKLANHLTHWSHQLTSIGYIIDVQYVQKAINMYFDSVLFCYLFNVECFSNLLRPKSTWTISVTILLMLNIFFTNHKFSTSFCTMLFMYLECYISYIHNTCFLEYYIYKSSFVAHCIGKIVDAWTLLEVGWNILLNSEVIVIRDLCLLVELIRRMIKVKRLLLVWNLSNTIFMKTTFEFTIFVWTKMYNEWLF